MSLAVVATVLLELELAER
ncbi:MAG: hypothetical protein VYE18_09395 [Pseudomonadota bacterium]|nr:hypothetical protein [Pseudomonadota bacterium]